MIKVVFLLLTTLLAVSRCLALSPVVFVPGYAGNALLVTVDSEEHIPEPCKGFIAANETFTIFYNVSLLIRSPLCISALSTLDYDSTTKAFKEKTGIKASVRGFGRFSGVSPVYIPFERQLSDWGYKVGVDAFAAPYDYRFMRPASLQQSGFIEDLKNLVETAYLRSGRKRVVLVGHSNGGPTLYSFLESMTSSWKDKYVSALVGLSGNYLGQMNAVQSFVNGKTAAEQEMFASWEANYMSMPWGDYDKVSNIPIVKTFYNTSEEQSYTSSLADISRLFESIGKPAWAERAKALYDSMNRSAHPQVNTYCFYGSEVSTKYSFIFEGNANQGSPISLDMEGDGNQDIIDNTFCDVWSNQQPAASKYITTSKAFPGVHHMQMYSDDNVLQSLFDILSQ